MDQKEDNQPVVPKITKESGVFFWTESFKDHPWLNIGARMIPIVYVIRALVAPDASTLSARANDKPHATKLNLDGQEIGLIEKDMVKLATPNHALFKEDSTKLYFKLEEVTQGMVYTASLKPHQPRKDDRVVYLMIIL